MGQNDPGGSLQDRGLEHLSRMDEGRVLTADGGRLVCDYAIAPRRGGGRGILPGRLRLCRGYPSRRPLAVPFVVLRLHLNLVGNALGQILDPRVKSRGRVRGTVVLYCYSPGMDFRSGIHRRYPAGRVRARQAVLQPPSVVVGGLHRVADVVRSGGVFVGTARGPRPFAEPRCLIGDRPRVDRLGPGALPFGGAAPAPCTAYGVSSSRPVIVAVVPGPVWGQSSKAPSSSLYCTSKSLIAGP